MLAVVPRSDAVSGCMGDHQFAVVTMTPCEHAVVALAGDISVHLMMVDVLELHLGTLVHMTNEISRC